MRIVHTSDWHAGKAWKRIDRTPELEAVLDHLAQFILDREVDLVLVTGDVFDQAAPKPEAERAVFRFFRRIGGAGVQSVVIAGNHDHPARLEAWGTLAELAGVRAIGRLRPPDEGGVFEIETRAGERAVVGAIPFTSMARFVPVLQLAADETAARQAYGSCFARVLEVFASRFRPDAVNLLLAHTDVDGARRSGSERIVHLGKDWAMSPQVVPPKASYLALGHIHEPQALPGSPAPARYAGSPLALDFGEVGEEKSFVFLEARPGLPVKEELIPYRGGNALRDHRATLEALERDASQLASAGWLRVTVPLMEPDPDLSSKVHRILPNAVVVRPELPEKPVLDAGSTAPRRGATPVELFQSYLERRGLTASAAAMAAFEALAQQAEGEV